MKTFRLQYSIKNRITGATTIESIEVKANSDKEAIAKFEANKSANKEYAGIREIKK